MKQKFEVGDTLLCYSSFHYEKAVITKIEGGIMTLSNQLKVDKELKMINSKNQEVKIEPYDSEKYKYLRSLSLMDKVLYKINSKYRTLGPEDTIRVYEKLTRIIERYFTSAK